MSPVPGPNLLFLGEQVLFEGHKTQVQRGFGWTMVFTDHDLISARIKIFDSLFESARAYTLETYGQHPSEGDTREKLRMAVIQAFEAAKGLRA